jgi:protein pelota
LKIIEEDLRNGVLRLQCETIDDLWVLYNIIKEGDVVYAKTTREVKHRETGESSRIPIVLGLSVKRVEFQAFTDKLRVGGVIVEGPEELGVKGKHHTVVIGVGDVITLIKEKWEKHELDYVKRFSTRRPRIIIVVLDYDEACIALLFEQGVKYLWEHVANMPSKVYSVNYEDYLKSYVASVVTSVLEISARERVDIVIVAGPGELKYRVASALRERLELPVYTDSTSIGGCPGVREVLFRDVMKKVAGEFQLIKAREIFELFKELLSRESGMVVYGLEDVFTACQLGAVKTLIIVDDFLKFSSNEEFEKIQALLRAAYEKRSEIYIIPGSSDLGQELRGFGGIVAILRFKIHLF